MTKISKKERVKILEEKFPEFKKISDDVNQSIDVILAELEEKIEKLEEIQEKLQEVEDLKNDVEMLQN